MATEVIEREVPRLAERLRLYGTQTGPSVRILETRRQPVEVSRMPDEQSIDTFGRLTRIWQALQVSQPSERGLHGVIVK